MTHRRIRAASAPLHVTLRSVPSKSVTHRALVAAALAAGPSVLVDPLDSDDTRATAEGLRRLGIPVAVDSGGWRVTGGAGRVPGGGRLSLQDSGTSLRFLLALAALGERPSTLEGSARLGDRPLADLAAALAGLGAKVRVAQPAGGLPAEAGGASLRGGALRVPGSQTSQFASALLLIGPCLPDGIDVTLDPPAVSLPYVELTAQVMAAFGARIARAGERRWRVRGEGYEGRRFRVDGDHSSASYFLAAAALVGGVVRVEGLASDSRQPDARFGEILRSLGCAVRSGPEWIEVEGTGRVPPFECDLAASPDLAPTLAALALFAEGPCVLRGVAHLRFKESDRVDVLARALTSLGRHAVAREDRLEIGAPAAGSLPGTTVATASDHRIAMAFAIAGLRAAGIAIDDAACVSKSHPGFWEDFAALEAPLV